ncbi:MAG: hypothetical protein GF331_22050 [Chitinivibrionales bacterium]|nr:hypothetical protein [Chitinivibrionales bacterium]
MPTKRNNKTKATDDDKRRLELTERYGADEAENIMRMERTEAASQYHQPPDQGPQPADVRTDMKRPRWRRKRRGSSLTPGRERHTKETNLPFADAREQGRAKRKRGKD